MNHPTDLLLACVERCAGSPVCMGIDPVLEHLHADVRARHHDALGAIREFGHALLRAAAGVVPAVKFQSACYERYGSRGVGVLEEHMSDARGQGYWVVLDAKRGDIGISASHYAAGAARAGAHAITVSGYLGPSGVEPFLDAGLGVFVLVRTSNPDSDVVQGAPLADGRTVAAMMADAVRALGAGRLGASGLSGVGAVVGATKSGEGAALRARMPEQVFLVPGYGAQGGTADDVRALLRPDGRGVLVTASRSIIYEPMGAGDADWTQGVRRAAERLRDEIGAVVRASA
ncbi:MAG: orotidine-5'-phosphate decarboxylase [Planctomycetota bacterium]|nr:orotidine-5'-phosphate decarboxylase [Planctomycetota bacterium]